MMTGVASPGHQERIQVMASIVRAWWLSRKQTHWWAIKYRSFPIKHRHQAVSLSSSPLSCEVMVGERDPWEMWNQGEVSSAPSSKPAEFWDVNCPWTASSMGSLTCWCPTKRPHSSGLILARQLYSRITSHHDTEPDQPSFPRSAFATKVISQCSLMQEGRRNRYM